MRSPFADCEAQLVTEHRVAKFRGEEYDYVYSYYECEKTKERFTTTEIDEENVQQVYRQYRERYGIPSATEIESLKEKYGVSAARLSLILGFGENQIGNYIDGEVPSRANGKTLSVIMNPVVFECYVDLAKSQLKDSVYVKLKQRIRELKGTFEYVNEEAVCVAEDETTYKASKKGITD